MATINADGTRLKECGNEIIELAKKYEMIIDSLFRKFERVNSYGWSGESADAFVRNAMVDRQQYVELSKKIKAYGNELYNVGESVNNTIRRWEQ